MRSPTQPALSRADIESVLADGLGAVTIVDAAELNGGTFATVWRAAFADGRDVVAARSLNQSSTKVFGG